MCLLSHVLLSTWNKISHQKRCIVTSCYQSVSLLFQCPSCYPYYFLLIKVQLVVLQSNISTSNLSLVSKLFLFKYIRVKCKGTKYMCQTLCSLLLPKFHPVTVGPSCYHPYITKCIQVCGINFTFTNTFKSFLLNK